MTLSYPIKNAPWKIIQIVKNNDEIFGPYFVYNSVDGIRRMGSYEFFEMLLNAHEYNIALIKITPVEFSGGVNPLAEADLEAILRTCTSENSKYQEAKVKAAFRTVWAAKTGEVINL